MKLSATHSRFIQHHVMRLRNIAVVFAIAASVSPLLSHAALTDIASVPLASSSTTVVKPNILFTLDDSGSMDREYMPDEISGRTGTTGFKNHLCNSVYYNPAITYATPKNADGTNFSNATFTSAKENGFSSGSSTRPETLLPGALTTTLRSGRITTSGAAAAIPAAAARVPPLAAGRAQSSSFPRTTGNWTKVQVTSTSGPGSTDERTNFANWYSFYRTRLLMMKSATGRAFAGIGSGYRVGFITINPGNPVSSTKYLAIADFDATQKSNWYTKLYSQSANSSTPLRQALARAGRHFAGIQTGINDGMTGDPMQYSCQQNFTILTTDGYWNGSAGIQMDGTAIGNHDGNISTTPRPLFDGSTATTIERVTSVNEFYSTSGCFGGRKRVRAATTITNTPISRSRLPCQVHLHQRTSSLTSCSKTPRALQSPNPAVTTETLTSTSGGSSGSLADVAAYYYLTDLRAAGSTGALGTDVGTDNNVPSGGTGVEDDSARHQHMTTFTMGLGLAGTLNYVSNYKTGAGDFAGLRSGSINWPEPTGDDPTALDELWHARRQRQGPVLQCRQSRCSSWSLLASALAGVLCACRIGGGGCDQ